MDGEAEFYAAVDQLPVLLEALLNAPSHRVENHDLIPKAAGIYLFSSDGTPVYVGQSRNLRSRLGRHTGAKSLENQASLAFNIAKREATAAGVDVEFTRALLQHMEDFVPHFDTARAQVAAMEVQFIEVPDSIVRTLLEVYATLALGTQAFNSFETH
jgi:hypothetical protein